MTYEAFPSPDSQALFSEAIIPLADNSITKRSLGIFGIEMFTLFGNLFSKSPFNLMSKGIFDNLAIK